MKLKYLTIFIFLTLIACKNQLKDSFQKPVAKVGGKYLYESDLSSIIPENLTYNDSTRKANDFILKWVRQELMLQKAEENLTDEQKDVQRELEEYRASLIIHRYQKELVKQRLDTIVTENDIEEFYNNNPERFTLNQNIVKGIYIEVPKEINSRDKILKWFRSDEPESIAELETFSFQFASKFDYFVDKWIDLSLIEVRLPERIKNPRLLYRQKRIVELNDTINNYYLTIKDIRQIGEKAPYNFVKDQIESLILNNRKIELINELERSVFETGKEKQLFSIIK